MKCGDCYYFEHEFTSGRKNTTCSSLGESFDNPTCPQFKELKETGPHFKFDYQQVFMDAVVDVFEMQKAADIVTYSINAQIKQQGLNIEFDTKSVLSIVDKLSDLVLIHKLVLGMDLGLYLDAIMSHAIADRFSRRDIAASTLPPNNGMTKQQDVLHGLQNDVRQVVESLKSSSTGNASVQSSLSDKLDSIYSLVSSKKNG